MPTEKQWRTLIARAQQRTPRVSAVTYLHSWSTSSRPAQFACSDRQDYVVKGVSCGRSLMNEHIVGRLGAVIGAPVAGVAIVHISKEILALNPGVGHLGVGPSHGSRFIPRTFDRDGIQYGSVVENRPRYALLAVLFGLVCAQDTQFIYEKGKPHLVHSVDHGEFFPGACDDWPPRALTAQGIPEAEPYGKLMTTCGLSTIEIRVALVALQKLTNAEIAEVVAGPPVEWGVQERDRLARAEYLAERRSVMLSKLTDKKVRGGRS